MQKTSKEAFYGIKKGDVVHSHFVFNYQGAVSFADIVVYNQNDAVKRTKTFSPYSILPLAPLSLGETAICSLAPSIAHVPHDKGQDLSAFLKPDANQAVYIATTDDGKAKAFVEASKHFQYHGHQARTAWVYKLFLEDTYPFKSRQAAATHIDFSCNNNFQIIGTKICADHQLKHSDKNLPTN